MTSEKQIQANRKNTLKSAGPKTAQGKLMVSSNAVKHGLLSKDVVIKDESEGEFVEFRQRLYAELAPVGELEQLLADRIIASFWRLRRVGKIEIELLNNMSSLQISKPGSSGAIPTMQITKAYEGGKTEVITTGSSLKTGSGEDGSCELSLGRAVHADFAGSNTLGKFRRYEAHIDRTLYKALHELQRLQAARLGHKVTAPVAIDIDVSKGDL
jgi:hypothetical protein